MYYCRNCFREEKETYYCTSCGVTVSLFNSEMERIAEKTPQPNLKRQRMKECILNLPTPKTRKDLFDFIALARSRKTGAKTGADRDDISDAWETKYNEFYYVAKMRYSKTPEFEALKSIHMSDSVDKKSVSGMLTYGEKEVPIKTAVVILGAILVIICALVTIIISRL